MPQRTLSGPFSAVKLENRMWRFTSDGPAKVEIYVTLTHESAVAVAGGEIAALDVTWSGDDVAVTVMRRQGAHVLEAASAIVHESKDRLYEALPLAGFDAKARLFWRRVFWLMRIPGGRYLLRLIAGRKR